MKKGEKMSKEQKNKVSKNRKGKCLGNDFRKGLAPWNKGKKGVQKAWNKGISPSKETREKLRRFNLGKKHSPETIEKLRKMFSGKNHYNWKGGITPLALQIRRCFEYRQWRSDVFTKDSFTCQKCGQKRGYLEAHHIKPFAQILEEYQIKTLEQALSCEELWNINNGITFCLNCHEK